MKLLVTLLLGVFVTLCSRQPTVLEQVRQSGELRVLMRHSLTSYYRGPDGPTGFEYDLARRFAADLGVELEVLAASNQPQMVEGLRRGRADLAAGLTVTGARRALVRFGPGYQRVAEQVVYRKGGRRPATPAELAGRRISVVANSSFVRTLAALKKTQPDLTWMETPGTSAEAQLEAVWQRRSEVTVANSHEVAMVRRFFPELRVAFDLTPPRAIAWGFPPATDSSLYLAALRFLARMRASGELERLIERHFGHVGEFDYVGTRRFMAHIEERLPRYRDEFRAAAREVDLDWRLLAAMGYQESHWKPDAVSPTGVRGIMMLTEVTAEQLGVEDRADPAQSITGGARYFRRVKEKIPERIPEPDRTWLALAAYNVGYGHLEDARVLTQRSGGDPDRWIDVERYLPRLSDKKWYARTRHGPARGGEAVRYVENVRRYYDSLVWWDNRRQQPGAGRTLTRTLTVPDVRAAPRSDEAAALQ